MDVQIEHRPANGATPPLTLGPLGVPLYVELGRVPNAASLAAAFEGWQGEPGAQQPALRLRIERNDRLTGAEGVQVCARETTIELSGPGVAAWADPMAGVARCEVSADYLAAPRLLREDVLDPLVLSLLAWHNRTPLHAAGFVAGRVAVLLAGRSGSGKSCLAKAADDAGYQLLSDDTVYIQLEPRLRVWGWPKATHLLPADSQGIGGPERLRNGKLKRVVGLRSGSVQAVSAERAVLCVLSRDDALSLSPLGPETALQRLFPLDPGFDLLPHQIALAIAALTARGAWELQLSRDPAAAIGLLSANLDRLKETATP